MLYFLGAGVIFLVIHLYRNMCVYDYRMKLLNGDTDSDMNKYKKLPDYDTMMNKFWVWPMSRFSKLTTKESKRELWVNLKKDHT